MEDQCVLPLLCPYIRHVYEGWLDGYPCSGFYPTFQELRLKWQEVSFNLVQLPHGIGAIMTSDILPEIILNFRMISGTELCPYLDIGHQVDGCHIVWSSYTGQIESVPEIPGISS